MKNLQDAGVLVTGGASGLGAATAQRLAASGAHVVVADLQDDRGRSIADAIGGRYVKTDVTDPESVTAAVHAAAEAKQIGRAHV